MGLAERMAGKMKEFTYLIPIRYLTLDSEPAKKPIAVKAWETSTKGVIVQALIVPMRGHVHLVHKASGTVIAFHVSNKKKAQEMARKLKKIPVNFTVSSPKALYRQFARLSDRHVTAFRAALEMRGTADPGLWRGYAKEMMSKFDRLFLKGGRRKPAGQGKRSKRGTGK